MESIERMLVRWSEAHARGDAAALDMLLDADFRGDGPCGRVLGKQEWLARHRRAEPYRWVVRLINRTAVAMGTRGAHRCTLVAIRRDELWTVVNVQIGHLADVPNAPCSDRTGMQSPARKEQEMGQVMADMSMSLDGYIADPNDSINDLIGWMVSGGEVEVPTATPGFAFRTSAPSAGLLRGVFERLGALVGGRRYFDLAGGWGGSHPMGVPVYIVTHEPPADWPQDGPIKFVTDGVESAVAQAKEAAGDKLVGVATPSIVQQCLDAGLLDAINVNLVPILLGEGVPFFSNLAKTPVQLDGPEVVEGDGVTHLTYRVRG